MKKSAVWKIDLVMSLVVIAGFEIIDQSVNLLESVPFYYDFLITAKWLLIAGFALHALISWLASKQ